MNISKFCSSRFPDVPDALSHCFANYANYINHVTGCGAIYQINLI